MNLVLYNIPVFVSTAVVKIRRLSFNRFWRACLISLHHTGIMCLTLPRFVSGSALLICHCYAPCETPESVSDLLLWCLRLHYYTGNSWLTCLSLGSDHWDATGRGGSEIHSCAGAWSHLGQCKFSILKSVLSTESPMYIQQLQGKNMQCDIAGRVAEALFFVLSRMMACQRTNTSCLWLGRSRSTSTPGPSSTAPQQECQSLQ